MIKYRTVNTAQEILDDVICDMCGRSCLDSAEMNHEYSKWSASWGYMSRKDDIQWNFHFCEDCSDKIYKMIWP